MTLNLQVRIDGDGSRAVATLRQVEAAIAKVGGASQKASTLAAELDRQLNVKQDFGYNRRAGDLEAYGREMDRLRAKYNPLFAASKAYKAELDGIRAAHRVGAISAGEMSAAIERTKAAFANQVVQMRGTSGGLKLNNQQLMNMQFQMNDMATMLASGQSPFVMMMQQGMQIGQIFGPGATVGQALRATGAGIVSFVTNPINLAVAATAVLAGGMGLLWDAFSGPEAKSAGDMLDDLKDKLDDLEGQYEEAGRAAREMLEVSASEDVLIAGFKRSEQELRAGLAKAIDDIALKTVSFTGTFGDFSPAVKEGQAEIERLGQALKNGEITAAEFADKVAAMRIDPDTPAEIQRMADNLLDGASSAREIEAGLQGAAAAASGITIAPETLAMAAALREQAGELSGFRIGGDFNTQGLRDEFLRGQERAAREAEREARAAERAAREAARRAAEREAARQTIADLDAEIAALSASGDERERLMAQLREEQQIRSAIASLGADATAAEIAQLQTLIPLRNEALAASRINQERLAQEEANYKRLASAIASTAIELSKGADAGEVFSRILEQMAAQALEFALQQIFLAALTGGTSMAAGVGSGTLLTTLFSANGNAFDASSRVQKFANGGVVNSPTGFMHSGGYGLMGEAGPEAILPLKRDASGRLGVMAPGASETRLVIALDGGLTASILSQAAGQSVSIIRQAAPSIAAGAAEQGAALARDSYSRSGWREL